VDSLQLVLVISIIVMALINAVSLIWASYLDHRLRQRPVPKNYDIHLEGTKIFSEIDIAEAQQQAKGVLTKAIEASAGEVQEAISKSVGEISNNINDIAQTGFSQEFEKYQISLSELQNQTIEQIGSLQKDVDARRQELLGQVEQIVAAERQKRMDGFNQRINEVVASYLAESLGDQVDLGAQGPYILQTLEQHKEDIKRDVLSA
jgi:hypothetical protein